MAGQDCHLCGIEAGGGWGGWTAGFEKERGSIRGTKGVVGVVRGLGGAGAGARMGAAAGLKKECEMVCGDASAIV